MAVETINQTIGRPLRLGIIGAGGIARRQVMPALRDSNMVQVAAVMQPAGASEIAAEFCVPEYYQDAASLINSPTVDAVYIASPVHCHASQIQLAAEAGKPILCEKPVGRSSAETRAALEPVRSSGIPFAEGFMMKFHGAHQVARHLLRAGEIGKPVSMRAQLSCWYPPMEGAWRQDPALSGGGALIDMATHCFDLLEFLTGQRVRGVFAMTGNQVHSYASEDSATILLEFDSGLHATVDTFFCIPDEASRNRLEIYGSRGAILAEGTIGQSSDGTLSVLTGVGRDGYDAARSSVGKCEFLPYPFEEINPYRAQVEAFAQQVAGVAASEIDPVDEAVHIAEIADAAYRSWQLKRFIEIPPATAAET